ncbi:MAG: hypothetical protein ACTHKY_02985 [Ginsengibacter sp.]|jgi:hypothetical protein
MKAPKIFNNGRIFISAAILFSIFFFSSCSKKIIFPTSSLAPAAVGRVKIKKDNNNNYAIQVSIENLPDAKRLSPPRNYYVVWIETRNNGIKKLGRIISSKGFLSSKMKASLDAVSPTKPTRVFITAENDEYIRYPGNMVVLDTGNF